MRVIQEIVATSRAAILWGTHQLEWVKFTSGMYFLDKIGFTCIAEDGSLPNVFSMKLALEALQDFMNVKDRIWLWNEFGLEPLWRDFYAREEYIRFEDVPSKLYRFKLWKVTDERDRIFAILGLRGPRTFLDHGSTFEADYSKPLTRVYSDSTKFWIRRQRDLDILSYAEPTDDGTQGFPGWCQWHKGCAYSSPSLNVNYPRKRHADKKIKFRWVKISASRSF
ncbi:hypothetical protein BCR34DRAFT_559791 [Clohesyomyces aquaticus]|uniref:Uncharacterized protein n=1 Tax=Clohesyomyces aquaticus TaxID=1231657 RepID=A0A1Y1ZWW8_9PLEO|nr:hypothetical protein BCR34DRAFT_559791 [Clohesyomyces aquaticus]